MSGCNGKFNFSSFSPSTWSIGGVAGGRDGTSSLDPASERPVSEPQASRGGAGLVGEKAVGSQGR